MLLLSVEATSIVVHLSVHLTVWTPVRYGITAGFAPFGKCSFKINCGHFTISTHLQIRRFFPQSPQAFFSWLKTNISSWIPITTLQKNVDEEKLAVKSGNGNKDKYHFLIRLQAGFQRERTCGWTDIVENCGESGFICQHEKEAENENSQSGQLASSPLYTQSYPESDHNLS